ncbi:hypothetical protein [Pedobacter sp. NJ-S-72]
MILTNDNNARAEKAYIEKQIRRSEFKGIQAWCADMWVLLWNAWLNNVEVLTNKELDFCWPMDKLSCWNRTKILHYSGVSKKESETLFCKTNYVHSNPFADSFNSIDKDSCSLPVIELIREFALAKKKKNTK